MYDVTAQLHIQIAHSGEPDTSHLSVYSEATVGGLVTSVMVEFAFKMRSSCIRKIGSCRARCLVVTMLASDQMHCTQHARHTDLLGIRSQTIKRSLVDGFNNRKLIVSSSLVLREGLTDH